VVKVKRRFLAAMLFCILFVSVVAGYFLIQPRDSSKFAPPKIGIFYYAWYNPAWDFSWNKSKIVDEPVFGFYNSSESAVISQQLSSISDLGVDFVIISWWGFSDYYGQFIDDAAKQVLRVAEDNESDLKFAIMVEHFNDSGESYNYADIYNHVYDEFVVPFSSIYYEDMQPLICFFNDPYHSPGLTPAGNVPIDPRFNTVIVGQQSYAQWVYTDLDIYDKPHRPDYDNQTSVTPRFDDSRFRNQSSPFDPNLTQGIYDKEWENASQLWKEGKVDIILITSWNEYAERTAIEPHYDATSTNPDPFFLYDQTKYYINQIKDPQDIIET
jgi:hypothetical protein